MKTSKKIMLSMGVIASVAIPATIVATTMNQNEVMNPKSNVNFNNSNLSQGMSLYTTSVDVSDLIKSKRGIIGQRDTTVSTIANKINKGSKTEQIESLKRWGDINLQALTSIKNIVNVKATADSDHGTIAISITIKDSSAKSKVIETKLAGKSDKEITSQYGDDTPETKSKRTPILIGTIIGVFILSIAAGVMIHFGLKEKKFKNKEEEAVEKKALKEAEFENRLKSLK